MSNMIKLKRIVEEIILYEGLEISHEIDSCMTNLTRMWNFDNRVNYEKDGKTIKMIVYKSLTPEELDTIANHIENFLGYFPSHLSTKTSNDKYNYEKALNLLSTNQLTAVYFDAKYDLEISEDKLPDVLYHISKSIYDAKISKIGLVPKTKNKMSAHPSRIYLTYSPKSASGLIGNPQFPKNDKFTLYSIDFKELKKVRRIRFFEDPAYIGKGIYTYENIPPQFLKVVKRT